MRQVAALLLLTLSACGSDRESPGPWDLNETATNNGSNNGATNNGSTNNLTTPRACEGRSFECVPGVCGGDWFMGSECIDGAWTCPEGWFPIDDCPVGSCFGLPLPGEVCDNGFQCRPDDAALAECPQMMCATCAGFDEDSGSSPSCRCACDDSGLVTCERIDADCVVEESSTLPGVSLRIIGDRCAWTRAELDEGVLITYEVVVAPDAPTTVVNRPQNAGLCRTEIVGGLIPFWEVTSDADRYCQCDVGLCDGTPRDDELIVGSHRASFTFHANNWLGESDTGNPLGPPFSEQQATISVRSVGDSGGSMFELITTMDVEILD